MRSVIGVDGCKKGWCAVIKDLDSGCKFQLFKSISDIYNLAPSPLVITLDMPIGLLDSAVKGGRSCEQTARDLLGSPRKNSVFSSPVRGAIEKASSYSDACSINRESSPDNIGISQQAYGIFPKLREVDLFITPEKQSIIKEIHPELCFYELNERVAMKYSKSTYEGVSARKKLLETVGFGPLINEYIERGATSSFKMDDLLDACVACWTAERIYGGKAIASPEQSILDSKGLTMEIWR